jgi:hypothetical protein
MCSDAVSAFFARLRRFALWVGLAFALSIFSQLALMTPGGTGGARAGDDGAFIVVCTTAGMLHILSTPATDDDAPPPSSGGFYCPLCVTVADDAPLPVAPPVFSPPEPVSARHLRPRAGDVPENSPDLRHAPPRAPPFAFA